jgi:hypothetical protein
LLLSAIFAGNFFAVCRCSGVVGGAPWDFERMNGKDGHCCCRQKTSATVQLRPAELIVIAREYAVCSVGGWAPRDNASSIDLPPHAPPDRLALYHCYLI